MLKKELICDFSVWFMQKLKLADISVDGCANSPDSQAVTFNSKGLFCVIFGGKKVTEIQKHSSWQKCFSSIDAPVVSQLEL